MANARHQACRSADRSGRVREAAELKEGVHRCRPRHKKLTGGLPTSSLPRYEPYLNADRQSDSLMSLEIVPRKFQPHPGRRRTAALVALGVPAIAADMPARPIARPAPAFSWTGCYLGVNIGYGTGTSRASAEPGSVLVGPGTVGAFGRDGLPAASPSPQAPLAFGQGADITPHFRLGGIMGGGTAGCQYQWASPWGQWVIGIEGDGGPFDKQGQANDQLPFNPQFVNQTNEHWIATLRGRLGYAVDKWLFYATGGVAWANVEETAWDGCRVNASGLGGGGVFPGCGAAINGPGFAPAGLAGTASGVPSIHDKQTMVGYAVGGGV